MLDAIARVTATDLEKPRQPATCACGNAATLVCGECGSPVCGLCLRTEGTSSACLKCRSGAVKRAELRELEQQLLKKPRSARWPVRRMRRRWVLLPATLVAVLAALSAVVIPLLDHARARAERRAQAALLSIVDAEERFKASSGGTYATIDGLTQGGLLIPPELAEYELRVDISKDRKKYWARAVPRNDGLRILVADERGKVIVEAPR
jgi:hypothetical protein